MSVPYTAMCCFGGGNVFAAQLRYAMGSFADLTASATLAATDSGTIKAEIPPATYSGAVHWTGTWLSPATDNVVAPCSRKPRQTAIPVFRGTEHRRILCWMRPS